MKTKNKHTRKQTRLLRTAWLPNLIQRRLIIWPLMLVLAVIIVGYQIVRANGDDGLSLTAPAGTVGRETQLDALELQWQAHDDQSQAVQQVVSSPADKEGLNHMSEVHDDAVR